MKPTLQDGVPTVPDGIGAIAQRMREAFGARATEVAEKWAREQDRRYIHVAARLRAEAER
jgi:hypothetical protein